MIVLGERGEINMSNKSINVLVTAVGNMGVGGQIVKALRYSSLHISIIGIDISSFNIPNDDLDIFYQISVSNDEEKVQVINNIIKKHDIDIVFVGCENDYIFFQKNRAIFENKSIYLAINSDEISRIGFDKYKTYSMLSRKGIVVPKFWKINTVDDCKIIDRFPVVIKPNRNSSASKNVFIAFSLQDTVCLVKYMLNLNIDIIVQEYIGNENAEYTIEVTSDVNANILGSIIIQRNFDASITYRDKVYKAGRFYTIASGITQGYTIHDEQIKQQAELIAKTLHSCGSLNIQAMFVNGQLLIIEVHPMMTSSVYIRALAGYNEPENIIKKEILKENVIYKYDNVQVIRKLVSEVVRKEEIK